MSRTLLPKLVSVLFAAVVLQSCSGEALAQQPHPSQASKSSAPVQPVPAHQPPPKPVVSPPSAAIQQYKLSPSPIRTVPQVIKPSSAPANPVLVPAIPASPKTALTVSKQPQTGPASQSTVPLANPRDATQLTNSLQNTVSGKQLQPATSLNAVSKPTISPSAIFVPNAHPGPVSRSPFQDQSCAQASNCVLFLRDCAHANMPHTDLTYWNQKMAIRNVFDPNSPKVGDVAIIQITSGPYAQNGHVAEVSSVNSDGTITIQEANYPNVGFEYRTGTPAQLNIAGYYDGSK